MLIYQVDAFTDQAFLGNPAAVVIQPTMPPEELMQQVALEMNLSETAFLAPQDDGYQLRWFTPTTEVDLCGHATLASSHVLWEQGYLPPDAVARFSTRSGWLEARRREDGWITMDFPSAAAHETPPPVGLLEALGLESAEFIGFNGSDWLIALGDDHGIPTLRPDMAALASLPRGVIVTAHAHDDHADFVSRFFAPAAGVPEDPVTGSAHCCLGPYWQTRLGKDELVGHQASARGGIVHVHPQGDRVHLSGQAVTVLHATLLTPEVPL